MNREPTPVQREINDLEEAINIVWKQKSKTAILQLVLLFVFACYNLWFTYHTASNAWEGKGFGTTVHRWAFGYLYLVVGLEALATFYYTCLFFIHMFAFILHHNVHSAPQSLQCVRALEMVGSFSFFMFLPGPKKLLYWYKNRHVAKQLYWANPQVLRMTREFHKGAVYFSPLQRDKRKFLWNHAFENFPCSEDRQHYPICHCLLSVCKPVLFGVVTFAWVLERCVKPFLTVGFVVFAIPAVILKLAMLPNIDPSDSTHALLKNISPYLGIILQSSRTWAIREIELCAALRFETIIHDEHEFAENIDARLRMIYITFDAMAAHLQGKKKTLHGCFKAMCMVSLLDNPLLAYILRVRYGKDTPTEIANFIATLSQALREGDMVVAKQDIPPNIPKGAIGRITTIDCINDDATIEFETSVCLSQDRLHLLTKADPSIYKVEWRWDGRFSQVNPFRWSSGESPLDTITKLRKYKKGCLACWRAGRHVRMVVWQDGRKRMDRDTDEPTYATIDEAIHVLLQLMPQESQTCYVEAPDREKSLGDLKREAREKGISQSTLNDVDDKPDPKQAVKDLLKAKRTSGLQITPGMF